MGGIGQGKTVCSELLLQTALQLRPGLLFLLLTLLQRIQRLLQAGQRLLRQLSGLLVLLPGLQLLKMVIFRSLTRLFSGLLSLSLLLKLTFTVALLLLPRG